MYELNNRAVELSKKGQLDEAIELFKQALAEQPKDSNINFNIALVYMKKEQYKEAIKFLEKSIDIQTCDDNLREMGVCYIKLGKLDRARDYLIRAITDFGSSDSENVTGVMFFQMKHYEEAMRHFEHAVKLKPRNRDAWFNLRDTYSELGMSREARMADYKVREFKE